MLSLADCSLHWLSVQDGFISCEIPLSRSNPSLVVQAALAGRSGDAIAATSLI